MEVKVTRTLEVTLVVEVLTEALMPKNKFLPLANRELAAVVVALAVTLEVVVVEALVVPANKFFPLNVNPLPPVFPPKAKAAKR